MQGGSLFAQDNLPVEKDGVITSEGVLGSGAITDNGETDVGANGSLEVEAPVSGTGVIDIGAGGTLQIDQLVTGAAGGQNQEFNVAIAGLRQKTQF